MTDYGATDTSTTTLTANQFPVSAAWVPGVALTPVEGMAVNTDGGGKKSTAIRMGLKDGDDVTLGTTTQTKATDGSATSWTVIQLLKGQLDKLLNGVPVTGTFWQATQPVSGTVTANAGTNLNTSALALEAGHLATIDSHIPAQGQALAAASMPVVLTAAQITTLTPPAAISGFALEAGHIATIDSHTPALGQALAASSVPVVLTAIQQTALTPPAAITGFALEAGHLATIDTHIPAQGQALAAASMPVVLTAAQITTLTPPAAITGFALEAGNLASILTQVTNHTVQPGNTANTTPWLASDHDGTNKAQNMAATSVSNAVGSQSARLTAGAYAEQASLTAGSLNADLVASTDVSNYKWLSLHVNANAYTGTLTFQGSNDNVNWVALLLANSDASSLNTTTSATNALFAGPVLMRYLRVRMTAYTSGTAQGTLELYTSPAAFNFTNAKAIQNGTWTVGSNSATGSAVPANAFYKGGIAKTALPAAASDGNLTGTMLDKFGRQIVVIESVRDLKANIPGLTLTTTTETTLIAAVASQFSDITGIIAENTSATAVRVDFRDSTAGTIQFSLYLPAGDVRGFNGMCYKQTTVNNNWTAQLSAAVTDVRLYGNYVKNQ